MTVHWLNHREHSTESEIITIKTIPGVYDPVKPIGRQVIIIVAGYGAHVTFNPPSLNKRKDHAFNQMLKYAMKAQNLRQKLIVAEKRNEFYASIYEHITKEMEQDEQKVHVPVEPTMKEDDGGRPS